MSRDMLKYAVITLLLISLALPGCAGQKESGPIVSLPQLNFELQDFIGKKVWTSGFYGDDRFTGDGVGFLILDFHRLMIDEKLPDYTFARLDGNLPPSDMNGSEILVYGEVKDFAQTYNVFTILPTPLITVEEYSVLNPPEGTTNGGQGFSSFVDQCIFPQAKRVLAQAAAAPGTKANACDRALIISGGVDANNNYERYRDNIVAKYKKLRELGFADNQTAVLYNNGDAINVDGANIVDDVASKQTIRDTLLRYQNEMPASCTLTIFVTDHGCGYGESQGWDGARPAFSGTDNTTNTQRHSEQLCVIDLRDLALRETDWINPQGWWWVKIDKKSNRLKLLKFEGGKWVLKGEDENGDGQITEAETGQDVDGDGAKTSVIKKTADLSAWEPLKWDTDKDGNIDVRATWDGAKYVIERLKLDGSWGKMGEDSNGDFVIDSRDKCGGIDWNLDGDADYYDFVGFHEGIDLWGDGIDSILWDDEFAAMLKPLHDRGIHILVEMAQCFAGGFIENLRGSVDKIVTFSSEDTKHTNRLKPDPADPKKEIVYAADEMAFVDNLAGIDLDSWNKAFDAAVTADTQKWKDEGSDPVDRNVHQKWEKPEIEGGTFWEEDGVYTLSIRIPESLKGKVYDIEILFGLQKPRWDKGKVVQLPQGFSQKPVPGGIKIESTAPFSTGRSYEFKFEGIKGAQSLRIHITDQEHKNIGYIIAKKGAPPPTKPVYTRSSKTGDYARESGSATGKKDYEEGLIFEVPGSEYIEFMKYRLAKLLSDPDSSVTVEMRERAGGLLEFLEGAADTDRQWLADIFMDSYFAAQQAIPPPIDSLPPAGEVLRADASANAESLRDESGCRSTLTVSYSAQDLTGGSYPVTKVVITVNGQLWHDSGTISTVNYQNAVSKQVGCGQTFNIQVTATNNSAQTVIVPGSITTPVP